MASKVRAAGRAQVALVIRVTETAGSKRQCRLLPPPEGSPSWKWTRKLWSCLKPSADSWAAIIQGNLAQVFSHLWKHQALFFQLGDAEEPEHLCVHFSELLDPSDVAETKLVREVELDEEFTGEGTLTICLQLFDPREPPEDVDADLSQLVAPSDGFLLRLQGLPALDKALDRSCERLRLRLDSVETSLDLARSNDSVVYQFPLVDSWEDLNEALSDLHVCLQLEDETSNLEIPLDLSDLIATLGESNGSDDVSVEVRSAPVMSFQGGFPFLATISRNQTAPREAPKDLDIWDRGARLLAVGPRHWRFSIEIRSVRLTERGANVFVSYSYPPLKQPRPFRTNPPNLLRKKATVSMPHSFAAYTLTSNFDDLQAGLEASPLYLEVWHRDLYRKDSVVGIAEADLSQLSSQPLQRNSIKLPSSVEGFRSLDQVCPIIDEDGSQVGALRVVVFLEDLGLVPGSKVGSSDRNVAKSEKAPATFGPAVAAVKSHRQVRNPKEGQDDLIAPLKGAYELEMWRQAEEEKFRVYLLEQEQELQDRLEEEFRQKEELRAADFAERKAKLQQLDGNVRRTLQELQERELAVVAEETKVSTLKEETKRRMGMAVSQHEDATKREATEAEHRLELSRQRSQFLEEQCQKLETKLETQVLKVSVLQEKQLERRLPPEATASAPSDLSEELQRLRIQLREQQLKNEAIAASRDHFKRKVEDLCSRLDGTSGTRAGTAQTQPTTSAGTPQGPDLVSALRQVQEDLAKLADSWTETPKRTPASARSTQATPESTQKLIAMRGHAAQDPVRQEQHLAWLCSQRHELLESGLYGSGDPVLQALELKIAQAEAQLRAVKGAERR